MKKQANEIVNEKVDAVSNAIANAVKVESSNELYPLENDLMFTTVMKNKDACIGLLETIFEGYKVQDIKYIDPPELSESPEPQKTFIFNPAQKSIRIDVYFKDKDSVYDIEIQRTNNKNLPKRARMYSSMMDANMLKKSLDYDKLKTSFVIFICTFDVFNRNKSVYFFENLCRDEPDLPLKDERYTIFLNTKSTQSSSNKDLDAFFKYLNGGISTIGTGKDSNSALVRILDDYVVGINGSEDWRHGFMKYELNLIESKNKGFEEGEVHGIKIGEARGIEIGRAEGEARGISIGREEGRSDERRRIVKTMYSDGLSVEKISQYASIQIEQVQKILQG